MAQETSTSDQDLREHDIHDHLALMRHYFDLLYTKNLDSLLELVDDNIQWLIVPTGDVIKGKAAFAELATNHWGASPDRTKKLLNLFASEDYACMEYTSGGHPYGRSRLRLPQDRAIRADIRDSMLLCLPPQRSQDRSRPRILRYG